MSIPNYRILLLIGILAGVGTPQQPPAQAMHPLVSDWLLIDCRVDQTGTPISDLKKLQAGGMDLYAVFAAAAQNGPDQATMAQTRMRAEQRYAWRMQMLAMMGAYGEADVKLKAARKKTQAQFVDRVAQKFTLRYKSRAIAGLRLFGGEKGRAVLQKIASDKQSPLRGFAQNALRGP